MGIESRVEFDRAALERALSGRQGAAGRILAGMAGTVTQAARRRGAAAITSRTGAYLAGFRSTVREGASGPELVVSNDVKHAIFIESGTRPHRIDGNPFLAFTVGGQSVVVRSVQHPGTKAQHVLRDTLDNDLTAAFEQAASSVTL